MELRAGPPAYYDWDGARWYLDKKDGYYRDRAGFLLHRAIWTDAHGTIPDGYEIHHVDYDRAHNALDNLAVVTEADHQSFHLEEDAKGVPWRQQQGADRSRERDNRLWANRQPHDVVCAQCGTVYQSTGMRARFCTPACKARFTRARRREELRL